MSDMDEFECEWGPVGHDDDFEDWDSTEPQGRLAAAVILFYIALISGGGVLFILWITNKISGWADR